MNKEPTIGVLALQGAVDLHRPHIEACGAAFMAVKTSEQFQKVDGFILPGGESTTMLKLIERFGLWDALADEFARKPVWGICAGSILMAEKSFRQNNLESRLNAPSPKFLSSANVSLTNSSSPRGGEEASLSERSEVREAGEGGKYGMQTQKSFAVLPMTVRRNGYGTQLESHQVEIERYPVSFIRAPVITDIDSSAEILARHQDTPVWVRKNNYMATTFHAELTQSYPSPFHKAFIEMV